MPFIRLEEDQYWNGEIDENIDPIGRRAPYCDCTGDDGEALFWGPHCEALYIYKISAEDKLRVIFDAAVSYGVTNHQEAVELIDAIVEMLSSGILHIRDVATGVDRILELAEYVDTDLYYFFWDRIIEGVPEMAEPLQIAVISQLSFADKSYVWDDPNARRLVGSVTEGDMRNSLYAIMRAFEQAYENIGDIYQYYMYNDGNGIIFEMFEVDEWDFGDNYDECTNNYLGIFGDGYLVDDEEYSEVYACIRSSYADYFSEDDYESYSFEVLINSDDALADNKMFVIDIAQHLAVFLTENHRAVTDMVFVGARRESGQEIELGTVTVTLVPAFAFPGTKTEIECGVMSQDADSGEYFINSDADCSKTTDPYFSNRIICECDIDSGWVVGYISSETALSYIEEERKDGKYEVAFGARETISLLVALVYFLFLA